MGIPNPLNINDKNRQINPAIEEKQDSFILALEEINTTIQDSKEISIVEELNLVKGDEGEILTKDPQIEKVFGSSSVNKNGSIKSVVINDSDSQNTKISGLGGERRTSTKDYSTCSIQISGVWAGTIIFEATSNIGDFVTIAGINITTNSLVQSTTTNGIFKFNVSGLQQIKVRISAYTSGVALVNFNLNAGEQQQPLSQRATTFELNTFDTNLQTLPTALGTTQMYQTGFELEGIRIVEPTVAPTQPTTYAQNKFANYPQKFRRLRVESGGSERQPFAQEANTNRIIISNPDEIRLLESMYIELQNIRNILLGDNQNISQ